MVAAQVFCSMMAQVRLGPVAKFVFLYAWAPKTGAEYSWVKANIGLLLWYLFIATAVRLIGNRVISME